MHVLLSFGANLGDPEKSFSNAVQLLKDCGFSVEKISSICRTPAWDCEPGAPDFSNCSVSGVWEGTPESLLDQCQEIEVEAGRPADHPYHHSRTLDIDILLMDRLEIRSKRLTVPHAHLSERDFYLIPSNEIVPDWFVPEENCTIRELHDALSRKKIKNL